MSAIRPTIFNNSDWQKYYPKENYNITEHGKNCFFHYLVSISSKQAATYAAKCLKVGVLTKCDTRVHNLTPLAIACMQGSEVVVTAILDRLEKFTSDNVIKPTQLKAFINAKDAFGWTPLHHASLTSEAILSRLVQMGADVGAKTTLGATFTDLQRYVTNIDSRATKRNVRIEITHDIYKDIAEVDSEELRRLTGLELFREDLYFPPGTYDKLWMAEGYENHLFDSIATLLKPKLTQFLEAPPRLVISICRELEDKGVPAYELRADQSIEANTIICQYAGAVIRKPVDSFTCIADRFLPSLDCYEYDLVTPQKIGNEARFSNRGFPNSQMVSIIVDGISRSYLLAARPIDEAEGIVWDYGFTDLSGWTRQLPLNVSEMEAYFKRGPKKPGFPTGQIELSIFQQLAEVTKSRYAIESPNMMLYLQLRGLVTTKSIKKMISEDGFKNTHGPFAWLASAITQLISEFDSAIGTYTAKEQQCIRGFVLNQIGRVNLDAILTFMSLLASNPPQTINNEVLEGIKSTLADFESARDPRFPLTREYVVKSTIAYYEEEKATPIELIYSFHKWLRDLGKDSSKEFNPLVEDLIAHYEKLVNPANLALVQQALRAV